MSHYHAVVWLDHAMSQVISFNTDDVEPGRIQSHLPNHHVHHKAGCIGAGKAGEDTVFFHAIATALAEAGEVIIVGPGNAKLALIRYLHRHAADIERKVVGVETVDHPSDRQVVAYARSYFKAVDRMRPQPQV